MAANVSRALGRLGVTVHAHLVVGTDDLGAQVRSQLDGWEGVEATAIPTPECPLRAIAARFDIPIAVMGMGSGTQGFLDAAELGRLESDAGMQPAVGRSSAQPGTLRPTK